jgi:hypothetical protein
VRNFGIVKNKRALERACRLLVFRYTSGAHFSEG